MTSSPSEPLKNAEKVLAEILFVEDSSADIMLTKAVLKHSHINLNCHFIRDGEEAIKMLSTNDPFIETLNLIFLDFNLPKHSGLEILQCIKSNNAIKHLPVIMLSGSDAPNDMSKAKELGAHSYMIKPLEETKLEEAIKTIPSLEFDRNGDEKYLYVIK